MKANFLNALLALSCLSLLSLGAQADEIFKLLIIKERPSTLALGQPLQGKLYEVARYQDGGGPRLEDGYIADSFELPWKPASDYFTAIPNGLYEGFVRVTEKK